MKKFTFFQLLFFALPCMNNALAQPSLKGLKAKLQQESNRTIQLYSLEVSPKNEALGSILLPASTSVPKNNAKQWISDQLQLRPGLDELRKINLPGYNTELGIDKYVQYYKGIKVEHGIVNVAGRAKDGKLGLIQMEFYSIADNFNTIPAISENTALQKAMLYMGAKKYIWEDYTGNDTKMKKPVGELVIVKNGLTEEGKNCLAYKFIIVGEKPSFGAIVFVDASDGKIAVVDRMEKYVNGFFEGLTKPVNSTSVPHSTPLRAMSVGNYPTAYSNANGTANTQFSGTQNIVTDMVSTSEYRLRQTRNGHDIVIKNYKHANANGANISLVLSNLAASDITNTTNAWTSVNIDDTALEVNYNMQVISDYWKNKHGRSSYDNANAEVTSYVHALTGSKAAFWNSYFNVMYFGDGPDHEINSNMYNIGPDVGLDITAHELGHALAGSADMPQFTDGREPGALNEGFSDIWGACVENYGITTNPGSLKNKKTWLIAEESIRAKGREGLRDLINPKTKEMPDTYYGTNYTDASIDGCPVPIESGKPGSNDKCGVHNNCSVLTKWFYLITMGGSGTNDHNYNYNVTGLGFGTSDTIAYNTERMLTSNADYHAAMNTSINYTAWKYGATSNQLNQVMAAWRAVGVLDTMFFNSGNTPAFTATGAASFNCITVGKGGHVWAGTGSPGKGLFKYDDNEWKMYDTPVDAVTVNKVTYRDMKTDKKGGVWIAQSGYSSGTSASNNSGGVYYFDDSTFKSKHFYTASTSLTKPNTISRNISSIWVDTTRNNDSAASRGKVLPQVWITAQPFLNGGLNKSGGVAMGLTDTVYTSPNCCATIPYDSNFLKITSKYLNSVDNRTSYRGAQTVGGNNSEVWVYSDSNNERSLISWNLGPDYYNGHLKQILRYNASNGDSIGVYDFLTVPLLGEWFNAKAIHFDKNDNRWLGMGNNLPPYNNAIVVMDNHGRWHSSASIVVPPVLSSPDIFPFSTVINNNAITSDKEGNVYIGTNNGLVVYNGGPSPLIGNSPLEDYKSYRRYTTKDGLPSNTIRGIAVDTLRKGVWLATDNGVVLWRFRGAARQIGVVNIISSKCNRDLSFDMQIKGLFYATPARNHIIAELSDANGSFASPVILSDDDWVDPDGDLEWTENRKLIVPASVPDGDNYKIRVRTTNPYFIGSLSRPFGIHGPTAILPSLGAQSHNANKECTDLLGWTHYFYDPGTPNNESDDIRLLSLYLNGNDIGSVELGTLRVTTASTAGAGSTNGGVPVVNDLITNNYVSMNRFWKVVPLAQPSISHPVFVRFYYNSQDLTDINGPAPTNPVNHIGLIFCKTDGDPDPTTNFNGATNIISYTHALTPDLSHWSYTQLSPTMHQAEFVVNHFSGGNGGKTPNGGPLNTLPLQLLSFTARQVATGALLQWQTTNEINTSHFILQHCTNGITFKNIGSVKAKNTSGDNVYSLPDVSPVNGVNFYRLQMVDKDGKITYSSIIKIVFTGENILQLFPNPAKNMITISGLQSKGAIKIVAADGKLIRQIVVVANNTKIDISALAKGFYLLQYNDGGKVQQVKFVKE